ncbi:sugar ABC transporter substrate-binding protein [Rhizobium sp. KVB221]|uniref:Sugar ABC transporter substrate-binding protein n=2 Tax=Rhizobium setariae TaxID=2801340 RepID=A0A937CQZ5_9HYPH|nr:sugar ABC transporter substrate-binding protein [Rhizobium setariae]
MISVALATLLSSAASAWATDVSILTPYISSIPTNEMAQSFKAEGEKRGWNVTIIDTRNDFGQLASRIEDTVNAKASAIVLISTDPAQVQDQVALAHKAGIPVISLDGAKNADVAVNVTSNNFDLGVQLSEELIKSIGGKGNIVKFYHSAHPGVHQRELGLDEVLKKYPDVKIIADHFVKVPGPVDDGRIAMENILRQHGDAIDGVWAAFDDPGIGAELATESEKPDSKLVIMGIDGNAQAVDMIKSCTHYKATLRQDFPKMATVGAEQLEKILAGGKADKDELYVPAVTVTPESLGVTCN